MAEGHRRRNCLLTTPTVHPFSHPPSTHLFPPHPSLPTHPPSFHPSVLPPSHLSICPFIFLSIHPPFFFHSSFLPPILLSFYLFSIHLFTPLHFFFFLAAHSHSESHLVVSNSLRLHGLYSPWNSPGQNTGVGSLFLLHGIFPTQGLNPGLLQCGWVLYQLSHQGSPRILEWVPYPFSS